MILDHTIALLIAKPIPGVSMSHAKLGMGLGIYIAKQAWCVDPYTYYEVCDDSADRRRRIVPADSQTSIGLPTDTNVHWFRKTYTYNSRKTCTN